MINKSCIFLVLSDPEEITGPLFQIVCFSFRMPNNSTLPIKINKLINRLINKHTFIYR